MIARVTIWDDGNIKGEYELEPTQAYDCGMSIKYKFDFEYCKLKDCIKEISYTPEEVQSILIEEGQKHGRKYGIKLGDTIKFSPVEVEKILKSESEVEE